MSFSFGNVNSRCCKEGAERRSATAQLLQTLILHHRLAASADCFFHVLVAKLLDRLVLALDVRELGVADVVVVVVLLWAASLLCPLARAHHHNQDTAEDCKNDVEEEGKRKPRT